MAVESKAAMPIIYLKMGEALTLEAKFQDEAKKYRDGIYADIEESAYLKKVRGLYEKALALKPQYFHGHRLLAKFYLDLGEPRLAEPHIQEARRIDPDAWNLSVISYFLF